MSVIREESLDEIPEQTEQQQMKSCFDKVSSEVIKRILTHLPLSDKKSARLVNHEWVTIVNELVNIKLPKLNDQTRREICAYTGKVPSPCLNVTKLVDDIESWSTIKFHHGPNIVSIIFENVEISTDNMIWLLTQCYSVKELQFIITATGEAELEIEKGKLKKLFEDVETMKAINITSRTLRSFLIKSSISKEEGNEKEKIEEVELGQGINICTSTTTTTHHISQNPSSSSSSSSNFYFDCSIFKSCRLLQSFIIIQLPDLKLKNLDALPLQIGHTLLQLEKTGNLNNNLFEIPSKPSVLQTIGFVDFSGPVQLKTFQYIFRFPKIKKYCVNLLSGQDIVELLSKIRGVSKIQFCANIQHYKILEGKINHHLCQKTFPN